MLQNNYSLVAVLNDNPSLTADADLTAGIFSVLNTGVAGIPWGAGVAYNDIVEQEVVAAATGVFGVKSFITNALVPAANTIYTVTVTPVGATSTPFVGSQSFSFATGASAPAIATLITSIAALITSESTVVNGVSTITAANVGNDLRITGNFGDTTIEVFDFSMTLNVAGITQSVVTPVVQPAGTPQLISLTTNIPLSAITAASYNTYLVKYRTKNELAAGTFEVQDNLAVAFVNSAGDAGVGTFNAGFTSIMAGTATTSNYLSKP